MHAGLPKYIPVNLKDIETAGFQDGDEVSLETLKEKASATEKLEAAGCSLTVLPGRKKWVKPSVAKNLARAEEYFSKKRAASLASPESASE
ncbi:50S ribosomal protein L15 [Hibiscus syriacus]|uniref:50S ribosomal protein L15 n=1 Tax=Hibiscus syriacus TaxID=106335 RepID=A0A6A2ZB51_HIBSY|nr:50S ribosomal protein L15 [Hibiscus syriacus]